MDDFPKKPLLMIDDDQRLCALVRDYLDPLGYDVALAHSGPQGLQLALERDFEAIILDVMLPGLDGFDVLRELRAKKATPVLMLTARGEEPDRIIGLEIGADDYLPKTFSTRELLARLRAVTRRSQGHTAPVTPVRRAAADPPDIDLVAGPLRVNPGMRTALLDQVPLVLTPVEFELLASLLQANGRVKSRESLVDEIAEREFDVFDRSVDVHISQLRKKLDDNPKNPRFIRTIRGVGYQLIYRES